MKPRLRCVGGVWGCASFTVVSAAPMADRIVWRIGYGYTPKEAYADWQAQGAQQQEGPC